MAAANPTVVSLEEYFNTSYEPECEYIDGELIPKAIGTKDHSFLQVRITRLLYRFEEAGLCRIGTELSVRIRDQEILIPDVCAVAIDDPGPTVVSTPALLCVEVLSPSDRFNYTLRKCEDYVRWGVPACWILDPVAKRAWVFNATGLQAIPADGTLTAGPIELALPEIWPL